MLLLGLTGSIGMGKSTTADMFRAEGVAVHDSDRAVHEIYAGPAAAKIEEAFPGSTTGGAVDRVKLARLVLGQPEALKRLEAIVHPLVSKLRFAFVEEQRRRGADIVVFDIPLLFEIGAQKEVDEIVVVTAAADVQRARVLARPGMTPEKFDAIIARQTPDAEKRRGADFVVHTDQGLDAAREQVRAILAALRRKEQGAV